MDEGICDLPVAVGRKQLSKFLVTARPGLAGQWLINDSAVAERHALPSLLLDGKWQLQGRRLVRPQIVKLVIHKVIARRGVVKVQSQMDHKLTVSMPALHGHFSEIVLPSNRLSSRLLASVIFIERLRVRELAASN